MLILSAPGDYGLFLLKELANGERGQYINLATLARAHHLPRKYLDHVAMQLVAAEIIDSREGRGGGYRLRRQPERVGFVEVLRALEVGVEPVRCTHDGQCYDRKAACERKTGWQTVHPELYELLKNKTLADVLEPALNT